MRSIIDNDVTKIFGSRSIIYTEALTSEKSRNFVLKSFNENDIDYYLIPVGIKDLIKKLKK